MQAPSRSIDQGPNIIGPYACMRARRPIRDSNLNSRFPLYSDGRSRSLSICLPDCVFLCVYLCVQAPMYVCIRMCVYYVYVSRACVWERDRERQIDRQTSIQKQRQAIIGFMALQLLKKHSTDGRQFSQALRLLSLLNRIRNTQRMQELTNYASPHTITLTHARTHARTRTRTRAHTHKSHALSFTCRPIMSTG